MLDLYRRFRVKKFYDEFYKTKTESGKKLGKCLPTWIYKHDIKCWTNNMLADSIKCYVQDNMTAFRNDGIVPYIQGEQNRRGNIRFLIINSLLSLIVLSISLLVSVRLSNDDSSFEKEWLQEQKRQHAESIKYLENISDKFSISDKKLIKSNIKKKIK